MYCVLTTTFRHARPTLVLSSSAGGATPAVLPCTKSPTLLGVSLGEVTASSDVPSGTGSAFNDFGIVIRLNGCAPPVATVALNDPGLAVTLPAFDPTAEAEVEVYAQIALTFAIAS